MSPSLVLLWLERTGLVGDSLAITVCRLGGREGDVPPARREDGGRGEHVICVYNPDYTDTAQVMRVENLMRSAGSFQDLLVREACLHLLPHPLIAYEFSFIRDFASHLLSLPK